ncbi:hypothetical protein N825_30715 [Skermanella stibiiresistens SB22]|uniref:Uncharacterized protein n=1 Tax=Skermanella stibiiresistens SB22 TaxID=1385369 RepID=W9HB09_9PROT|nr:hypothetical protein [Skermanella stibiiresistens]EWY41053.1 hypothetical protein N825_30715 [Skermanella stibiiresistens SB22]
MRLATIALATALALTALGGINGVARAQDAPSTTDPHDYPTPTRVDYVIGCMASNGQTHEAMERCSCSIDHIAKEIPYTSFVQLETIRRMQDQPGERAMLFRGVGWIKDLQDRFRLAQVEADLECFPQ